MPLPAISALTVFLALVVVLATVPVDAEAQAARTPVRSGSVGVVSGGAGSAVATSPDEIGAGLTHSEVFAANALIGALTAAISRALRGEGVGHRGFWRGVLHGAAGGGIHYGGKVVSSMEWTGSGLLGRQVAGVGSSVVRSAGVDGGPFEELIFPAWALRLHVRPGGGDRFRAVLDLSTLLALARGLVDGSDLDARSSLATGAFVLEGIPSWAGREIAGGTSAGVVFVDDAGGLQGRSVSLGQVLSHENVHVVQHDFAMTAWGVETDRLLFGALGEGRIRNAVRRHVATGLYLLPKDIVRGMLDPEDRPWEWEAHFLDAHSRPADGGGGARLLSGSIAH